MRIVEVIPSLQVGGAERVVSLLAAALQQEGEDVTVLSLGPPSGSWLETELQRLSVPVLFFHKGPGFEPAVIPRLARALFRIGPAVVHSHLHTLKYLLPAHVGAPRSAIVHTLHNLALQEATLSDRRLQQLAFRLGVVPVAIGDAVAESFSEVYRVGLYRMPAPALIPNGIPVAAYQRPSVPREELRRSLRLSPEIPVFLSVGRLNPQKDPAALLDAFADPRLSRLEAQLLLAGEGELRPALEEQARRLGIGGRVHFLGVRGDIPDLLAAADVFVLSSRYEGNPLVIMEAMSAGLPVVATAVGCVPELVCADTGRLVPAGDGQGLRDALSGLAQDRPAARRLGAGAAQVALRRFDVSVMAQAYQALFRTLRPDRAPAASGVSGRLL